MKAEANLREVRVQDAVGLVLAHDLTQILPGQFKGSLFKKGHVIREADIPSLLNIGKEHIYILALLEGFIHEDEAAKRLALAVMGEHLEWTEPHEGKVSLKSTIHGLAKVDREFIQAVNSVDSKVIMSTLKNNTVVKPKQAVVGTRPIPLVISEEIIVRIEQMAEEFKRGHTLIEPKSGQERRDVQASQAEVDVVQVTEASVDVNPVVRKQRSIVSVKPFRPLKVGMITTGSEVFSGRISDKFGPIVKAKLAELGSEVIEQRLSPDISETIVKEINYFLDLKVDLILITGGMSVDPDDRTPGAIKLAGAEIISYGTPMLPGSMLMIAYLGEGEHRVPVLGLPGCVMHDPYTSFDVLLPRICAGEKITRQDIIDMGYGGLYGC